MREIKKIPLSGYWLLGDNWKKNGRIYLKGEDEISYDGTNFKINGHKIQFTDEIDKWKKSPPKN